MTASNQTAPKEAPGTHLLVHVLAHDEEVRQRLSETIASNPALCVTRSDIPTAEHSDEFAPDAIVAYADCEDDCRRIHELAARHPNAFCALIVSEIDLPPKTLETPNVNHVNGEHPDAMGEILSSLLNGHVESDRAQPNPLPVVQTIDQERLERLTDREREILCLTAEGLTIDEIAKRLTRSPATVAKHRNNIMAKTGLHDRVALTRFAIRVGLATA